mmetsp:Transcript_113411/g.252989  ORF Transcript_113411/g.252989 Transcript_113411/m.252989 type:complete len:86 (-) Transcript_113411:56-313(-)
MDGPFSFSDAPEEYLDFLREKRRQVFALVIGACVFGSVATCLLAAARGEASEAVAGVEVLAALMAATLGGLGAFGLANGGTQREF